MIENNDSREIDWERHVKNELKGALKTAGISYKELAVRLQARGISENPENIANKISRGRFSAVFRAQVMDICVMETKENYVFDKAQNPKKIGS